MSFSIKNWNKASQPTLVMATGIISSATAFAPQFLSVLHEAPFPVSSMVDAWITWLMKVATVTFSVLSIFSRHQETKDANGG